MFWEFQDNSKKIHQLLEVLPTHFKTYFHHFSQQQRRLVQTIVVDLNVAYIRFIPQLFAQAQIIIDRFHLVQMSNRAVNAKWNSGHILV